VEKTERAFGHTLTLHFWAFFEAMFENLPASFWCDFEGELIAK
jgi:hypothetical protein